MVQKIAWNSLNPFLALIGVFQNNDYVVVWSNFVLVIISNSLVLLDLLEVLVM